MCKKRIGVIFGGRSEEHEVSLKSAAFVMKALNPDKFVPVYIGITKEGNWKKYEGAIEKVEDDTWQESAKEFNPIDIKEETDFVLPVLHGPYGEDGCIQGFLETIDIPYGGCGVLASAVSMDKEKFKQVMEEKGLNICRYQCLYKNDFSCSTETAIHQILDSIGMPCFVKPANMGSSVGISKVKSRDELKSALENAFKYDDKVVVEEYIKGRELEVAVLGGYEPDTTDVGEIIPSEEFYDYEAKYLNSSKPSKLIIPAKLPKHIRQTIKQMAVSAYKAVDGWGFARVDFFYCEETEKIYINEINTIPGFTSISMFPLLWKDAGLEYGQIIERIIDLGYERHYIKNNR